MMIIWIDKNTTGMQECRITPSRGIGNQNIIISSNPFSTMITDYFNKEQMETWS